MARAVTSNDGGRTARIRLAVAGMVAVLTLAGCGDGGSPDHPPAEVDSAIVRAESFDHAALALPDDGQLPAGFSVSYRCPGDDACPSTEGFDAAAVFANGEPRDDVEEGEIWPDGWFHLTVEYHPDAAAAAAVLERIRDDVAPTTAAEFQIEAEPLDGGGFAPGREGGGELADQEIAGWTGFEGTWSAVLLSTEGDRSAPRQEARLVVTHERTVVRCSGNRYLDEGDGLARDDCREAVSGYLARLGEVDAATAPRVATVARLAAAMPGQDHLPAGHEITVRCPGDPPCTGEDQTYDASVSAQLPLPEGVAAAGDSGIERYRVPGGEWSERLWLRAWIHSDEDSARSSFEDRTADYGALVGELDTAPKETDNGYTYGIRGRGEVIEIGGADPVGWTGALKVYDARFIHLDGRITERRYDINGVAYRGNVRLTVDSSFTVEGRTQADAVDFVRAQVAGFFERLAQA